MSKLVITLQRIRKCGGWRKFLNSELSGLDDHPEDVSDSTLFGRWWTFHAPWNWSPCVVCGHSKHHDYVCQECDDIRKWHEKEWWRFPEGRAKHDEERRRLVERWNEFGMQVDPNLDVKAIGLNKEGRHEGDT